MLVCGVFGNLTDDDVERTVDGCTQLCRSGGAVIWTRHRADPDLVPRIGEWFRARRFELRWLSEHDVGYGVGVHRFAGEPEPLEAGASMFTFVGYDVLTEAAARGTEA